MEMETVKTLLAEMKTLQAEMKELQVEIEAHLEPI